MARSRNIKPGFFKNDLLAEMPPETRLLFMGLWCLADREGRFEDRPKKIKMELFPLDDFSIELSLSLLAEGGFLIRYEVGGSKYCQVVNFTKHQMPHHKEVASEIPAPPGHQQITKHTYDVSNTDRDGVFNRDERQCLKCGSPENLSLDHIVPLASGGDNSTNNLQTLCKTCNSSKGNSTKDYRKSNVDSMLSQRKANDSAYCPTDSLLLIPDSLINTEPKGSLSPARLPTCPHETLIDLFAEHLPALPQPKKELWAGKNAEAMRARWRWVLTAKKKDGTPYASTSEQAVAWFARFFGYVEKSDFLSGRSGKWTNCNLGWLVKADNFAKVVQGNYEQKTTEGAT